MYYLLLKIVHMSIELFQKVFGRRLHKKGVKNGRMSIRSLSVFKNV